MFAIVFAKSFHRKIAKTLATYYVIISAYYVLAWLFSFVANEWKVWFLTKLCCRVDGGSETRKFAIKRVQKSRIFTVKDYEAEVTSVSPLSSLADYITKLTFRAFALRRHLPIRLRSWRFEGSSFVVTCRLDYEAEVASLNPSSFALTKG